MSPSWSRELFLRINRHIGERKWLDRLMLLFAHYVIYGLFTFLIMWLINLNKQHLLSVRQNVFPWIAFGYAYLTSYAVALLWRHERPVRELRYIKQLLVPFGTWKSFPSDHTIAVTIIPLTVYFLGGSMAFVVLLAGLGIWVALGRVYVGVHYPRDIVGGLIVGSVGVFLAYRVLFGV